MTHLSARRGLAVFAAALLLAPLAMAQTAPPPAQAPTSPASPAAPAAAPPTPEAAANQRIQTLQSQLHITAAEMPQWNAFAAAMRHNAVSTDALFRERAKNADAMNALDNMKSYVQIARAYADNTAALEQAFEPLYEALSPQQKQTIDTLFREEATKNASAAKP